MAKALTSAKAESTAAEHGVPKHPADEIADAELGDAAHSRYNAILARVASFARAAGNARAG